MDEILLAGFANEDAARELMNKQLACFKEFLAKFKEVDDKMNDLFEKGDIETLFPPKGCKLPKNATAREFAKLQKEYAEFKAYFERFDGNYWGGYLSVMDIVDRIEEETFS